MENHNNTQEWMAFLESRWRHLARVENYHGSVNLKSNETLKQRVDAHGPGTVAEQFRIFIDLVVVVLQGVFMVDFYRLNAGWLGAQSFSSLSTLVTFQLWKITDTQLFDWQAGWWSKMGSHRLQTCEQEETLIWGAGELGPSPALF